MTEPVLIELDSRRRCSLGKIGRPEHTRYLATTQRDGTMILTPAVIVPESEVTQVTATISGGESLQAHRTGEPYNATARPEPREVSIPVVADGFGSVWAGCDRPDCDLQVVRPGKAQCHGGCETAQPAGGAA